MAAPVRRPGRMELKPDARREGFPLATSRPGFDRLLLRAVASSSAYLSRFKAVHPSCP